MAYNKSIRGITVEIRGNSKKLDQSLAESKVKVTALNKEIKALQKDLNIKWNNQKFLQAQDAAKAKVKATEDRVSALKQALEQINQAKLTATQAEITQLKGDLIDAENKAKSAKEELKKINNLKLDNISKQANKVGTSLDNAGQKATTLSAAIVTGFTASGKAAMDFGNSMSKVKTIADTSEVSMDQLRAGVLDISDDIGKSATDISEATYEAISSGVKTADAIATVDKAGKASVAGFTDIMTTIDAGTTIINAYGRDISELTTIFDEMIVAQDFGKTTLGEMAEKLGDVVPIAAQLEVGTKELFAALSTLTLQGQSTDTAITNLKGVLSSVIKPTEQAKKEAEALGIEFNSTALKSKGLKAFLDDIQTKTAGNSDSIAKLFGNVRALNGALVLTGTGSADFVTAMEEMENSAGAVEQAFNIMAEDDSFKVQKALNEVKNAAIELGAAVLPMVNELSEGISNLADWFKSLTDEQQQNIVKLLAIAAAIGPVLLLVGKLSTSIAGVTTALVAYRTAATAATAAQVALNAVQSASIIGLLALAIGGTIAAITMFTSETDTATEAIENQNNTITNTIKKQEELKQSYDDTISSIDENTRKSEIQASKAEELANTLYDLQGQTKQTKKSKEEMLSIVQQLNKLIPDLNLQYNEERNQLSLTRDEVDKNIKKYRELALAKAATNKAESTAEYVLSLEEQKTEVEKKLQENGKKTQPKTAINNFINTNPLGKKEQTQALSSSELKKLQLENEALFKKRKELDNQIKEANKQIDDLYKKAASYDVDTSNKSNITVSGNDNKKKKVKVKKTTKTKTDIYNEKKENIEYQLSIDAITEKQYYTKLGNLQKKYLKKNSEEYRAAEVEIYNHNKKIKEQALEDAYNAEVKAAQEAYEKKQKALQDAANAEIETIEKTLSAKEKAIDAEIAAIDKAIEARQRAKDAEESNNQIQAIQAQLQYSKLDDFSRRELESQLKQLQDETAEKQWQQEQADKKQALEDEKTAAQELAEAQKNQINTVLEKELSAIESTYNSYTDKLNKAYGKAENTLSSLAKSYKNEIKSSLGDLTKSLNSTVTKTINNYVNNNTAKITINGKNYTQAQINAMIKKAFQV